MMTKQYSLANTIYFNEFRNVKIRTSNPNPFVIEGVIKFEYVSIWFKFIVRSAKAPTL